MSVGTREGARPGAGARRAVGALVSLVRLVTSLLAAVLVVHVVLTVGSANPVNPITVFFRDAAARLTLGLSDLFVLADPRLTVLVNHGLAAILWLVIGALLARVLRATVRRRRSGA